MRVHHLVTGAAVWPGSPVGLGLLLQLHDEATSRSEGGNMNQRDRLAEVLHLEAFECDLDYDGYCGPSSHMGQSDALITRGVRVVDAETLAAAMRVFIWDQFDGDVDEGDRRQAEEFLAVLDGGNRTENGTETTPDAEDDEGPVRWIWNIPSKEADR